ncbi:MAG: class I mannose-6-phosphate isomerase [Verrucomicrobia bacterium]|nr:class I mannose-6-phosphate isomerase [Verrucomicrobiota bacterium]
MEPLYPLTFEPILLERIWGGRRIESVYNKKLPLHVPIGESWEVSDRPGAESIIANGPLQGLTLRWLMEHHRQAIMGKAKDTNGRFPLLVKILDAQEDLSVQVHPPGNLAASLGGESKTEMWRVTHADTNAHIFTGFKKGITRETFLKAIEEKQVPPLLHCHFVKEGDSILIPSGGMHSLGAGTMVFEFQENSDTTYRAYDWDRVDSQGNPRKLHLEEALKSIDFNYVEPPLIQSKYSRNKTLSSRFLVNDPAFICDEYQVKKNQRFYITTTVPVILGIISGELILSGNGQSLHLKAGCFALLPPGLDKTTIESISKTNYLMCQPHATEV